MATNITQDRGDRLTVVAPAAVTSGGLVVVGQAFGIAVTNAASAANVALAVGVNAVLRKLTGAGINQGANVHWDATNANCTVSATSNAKIGVAAITAASADTTVEVRLNGSF